MIQQLLAEARRARCRPAGSAGAGHGRAGRRRRRRRAVAGDLPRLWPRRRTSPRPAARSHDKPHDLRRAAAPAGSTSGRWPATGRSAPRAAAVERRGAQHRLPLPRPRPAPGAGPGRRRQAGALPRHPRRQAAGRRTTALDIDAAGQRDGHRASGSTSWCASRRRDRTARSRSSSSTRAPRPSPSPSARQRAGSRLL